MTRFAIIDFIKNAFAPEGKSFRAGNSTAIPQLKVILNCSILVTVWLPGRICFTITTMKKSLILLTLAGLTVFTGGCVNPDGTQNNTGSGALIGGAFGALAGAVIGGASHNAGAGALIGAAAGAVGGGLIGHSMDQEQNARLQAQAPVTYVRVSQGQPLAVTDVEALAKAGVTEDVIISQIQASHTVYHLSAGDIIELRDAGVTDRVVNYMINTPNTISDGAPPPPSAPPAPVVVQQPPPPATIIVQQDPPPPPADVVVISPGPDYVWVGGEYTWVGANWVWVGGHWGYPPHPHAIWVGGSRWHDGHGWHYTRGYWR